MDLENTNWNHWQNYTSGLSSPQNFVDWGFVYLVASSLQRRVWCPPSHKPLFPNMYVILVGEAGIGKGLVIGEVSEQLNYWKLSDIPMDTSDIKNDMEKTIKEEIAKGDLKAATEAESQGKSKGAEMVKPLVIPIAADATTYEALIQAISESYRRKDYIKPDNTYGVYGHSSIAFSLQELGSLMRKKTDDTVRFLLGLYDCPLNYEYKTKTQGKDRIRRGCVNLFAGTTPTFMQETFDEKLAGEGFTSRTFFVFSNKNRKNRCFISQLDEDQVKSKKVITDHILKLTQLFGEVKLNEETIKFMNEWWDYQENNKHLRVNKSLQMKPYYSRKNIHVMKLAMALHFGETTDMNIPLERFKQAIIFLEKEEKNMHFAITLEMDNVEARIAKRILAMLDTGKKSYIDIIIECNSMGKQNDITQALDFLVTTNQCEMIQEHNELSGKDESFWKLKREKELV